MIIIGASWSPESGREVPTFVRKSRVFGEAELHAMDGEGGSWQGESHGGGLMKYR